MSLTDYKEHIKALKQKYRHVAMREWRQSEYVNFLLSIKEDMHLTSQDTREIVYYIRRYGVETFHQQLAAETVVLILALLVYIKNHPKVNTQVPLARAKKIIDIDEKTIARVSANLFSTIRRREPLVGYRRKE